jgi:serine/threonine protein kinase
VVRAAAASGGDKGGWLRPLEGLAQRMGVTIYQAPAPPAVVPGARVDFLESMLQWHLDTSTSADLVMREVQDAIVAEVTSFPVDKVAVGESPSVAMHVPIPLLRQSPDGPPSSLAAMGARSQRRRMESDGKTNDSSSYGKDSDGPLFAFPEWDGWTQPTTAMTLRAVLMTASALSAAAGMRGTTSSSSKTRDDEESRDRVVGSTQHKGGDSVQILLPLNPAVFEEDLASLSSEKRDIFADERKETETGRVLELKARESNRRKNQVDAESLRLFFEKLWPDSPYSFGTYDRENVTSDVSYLLNERTSESFDAAGKKKRDQKKRERRLVVIVNVSAPGNETAAESDGEGMVNAAETLLELGVPFVVLTLWMDDSLARGVKSGRPAKQEREALRVRMEKRTRILLGRSVKRKEARENVRRAFEAAKKQPQGAGYVALEEALAEARAVGADAGANGAFGVKGGEAEAMLAEIRAEARAAEASALAAALTAACLQVPVDVGGLEANLVRARGVLARAARDGAAVDFSKRAALSVDDATTARAARDWNESAAEADRILSLSPPADENSRFESGETREEDDDANLTSDDAGVTREDVMSADVDRFASGANEGGDDKKEKETSSNTTSSASLASLRAAVDAAEAALEAVSLEGDLRAALADETSLEVSAVPRLEGLMLRAAKVAERKPPLTQEGAAKLNALTSRCFSRATALQEMEEARAALAKALEPSLRGEDLQIFVRGGTGEDLPEERPRGDFDYKTAVPALERAVSRAQTSAWPWQLADAAQDAETVLERWRAIGRVRDAFETRNAEKIRREIAYAKKAFPEIETRQAERALAELEAEDALEGGDRRLKAYFAASKMAWSSGAPNAESAEMLRTIRDSLAITDAEHEQVTKAVSAGSRTASENARAKALEANAATSSSSARHAKNFRGTSELASVSFSASVTGTRGPMFEGSNEFASGPDSNAARDEAAAATELYVLNWDDETIELYVGGAGPRTGEFANATLSSVPTASGATVSNSPNTTTNENLVADEATRAWLSAVPDDSGGEYSDEYGKSGGWRRVGADIIYNEEEIVGVGSSGTYVFRGYVQHTTRARHAVAVKRIARPPGEEGRELLRLVEREVELLTTLNQSPRVPFFHRWAATSSHVFIALELCAESLREHVVRLGDSMPVERRFEILRDVADGIAWLHDPNKPGGRIAHNDLKPENLLVDSEGDVKIADVGLGVRVNSSNKLKSSKRLSSGERPDTDDEAMNEDDTSSEYTMSTFRKYGIDIVLAGRAPEMLAHRPLTPAADVWAMGVVFFFALTGRASPFSESGRDVPTDAAIINGRHHLQCVMNVPGLSTRRALEARHLLASMLAPDPNDRPTAFNVRRHPLFWSDETFLSSAVALHRNSASFDKDLGSVLGSVADDALVNGAAGGGNAERGALLAAASMDLTDWKRLVDGKILKRVTKAHASFGGGARNDADANVETDVGRKPYGDNFSDLIRFCRNVSEHPPTIDEVEPMIRTLTAASADSEARAAASAAAASAKKSARRARVAAREGGNGGSENINQENDASESGASNDEKKNEAKNSTNGSERKKFPGTALFPPGVDPTLSPKRLTREQRRLIFAAYVAHLFPGMPLAVFEVAKEMDAAKSRAKTAREARASGKQRQKQRGRPNAKARGR